MSAVGAQPELGGRGSPGPHLTQNGCVPDIAAGAVPCCGNLRRQIDSSVGYTGRHADAFGKTVYLQAPGCAYEKIGAVARHAALRFI
jgi:hypothetical protein